MADSELREPVRMSGFESLMWDLERDPKLSSSFANLSVFDRPPDRAKFRARMAQAISAVPRLGQRVVESRNPLEHPQWVEEEHLDLDHHLRWVDLGGDATMAEVQELAATLSRQPFDRERPLWEFVTIEGLRGGRAAMLQRMHHTITDGEGGIRLSVQFLDLERDPGDAPAAAPPRRPGAPRRSSDVDDDAPTPGTSWWNRVPELGQLAASGARQVRVGRRRSPLWTERSLRRWFGTTTLSLEEVRDAAHHLGGSVNDLFITGATAAAADVHNSAGRPVDELRVSMPVSTRHDRSVGGNAFSPTQTLVPTGDMGPDTRFTHIHRLLDNVKTERVVGALEGTAAAVSLLPPVVTLRSGQYLAGSVDFVCSNVRAAPFDLFIGGAWMEANYPLGPLAGTAFNLTTMSYRGWLFLGLLVDPAAVDDPPDLLARLEHAYTELLAAGGIDSPSRLERGE